MEESHRDTVYHQDVGPTQERPEKGAAGKVREARGDTAFRGRVARGGRLGKDPR